MSVPTMMSRPASVTFASAMMFIGALGYAIGVVINLTLLMRPDEAQLLYGAPVSDWFWIINGTLDAILVVGFIWVGRMALRGDYGAGMTITLLAVLNIFFALFKLGHLYGWLILAVSVAVLAANLTASAQAWYRRGLPVA